MKKTRFTAQDVTNPPTTEPEDVTIQEVTQEDTQQAEQQTEQGYNLADTNPPNANNLQYEWIRHVEETGDFGNFFIVDGSGRMWLIGPDRMGQSVTALPLIQTYEYGDESAVYQGPDAWDELFTDLGQRFSVMPQEDMQAPTTRYTGVRRVVSSIKKIKC